MSLFFLLNPKQFIDPNWSGLPNNVYKKKKVVIQAEEIAKEALVSRPVRTIELDSNVNKFIGLSQKLLSTKDDQLFNLRESVAEQIVQMEEEENMLVMLLLH